MNPEDVRSLIAKIERLDKRKWCWYKNSFGEETIYFRDEVNIIEICLCRDDYFRNITVSVVDTPATMKRVINSDFARFRSVKRFWGWREVKNKGFDELFLLFRNIADPLKRERALEEEREKAREKEETARLKDKFFKD